MKNLIEPQNTIAVLKAHNIHFKKKFGQNFLIDSHVLGKIVDAARITKEDVVLEIGPGIGTMTQALSKAAGKVYAVEIDRDIVPILKENLEDCDNVEIIVNDILKIDLNELSEKAGKPFKVVANLPYYITTPIIMTLLEKKVPVTDIVVMVQKEVAERMDAKPGTKEYGALTLAVQYYSETYLAANVPQNSFIPRPDVTSAVIRLHKYETPIQPVENADRMFAIIRSAFNMRRKTLMNGLKSMDYFGHTKEEAQEAVKKLGKGESVRGETLSLQEFAKLSDLLG